MNFGVKGHSIIGFAVKADFRRLVFSSAPLRQNVKNALLMRWQSHQSQNICDVSMVSLVARWPVFWPVFDLRICSRMANPIDKLDIQLLYNKGITHGGANPDIRTDPSHRCLEYDWKKIYLPRLQLQSTVSVHSTIHSNLIRRLTPFSLVWLVADWYIIILTESTWAVSGAWLRNSGIVFSF